MILEQLKNTEVDTIGNFNEDIISSIDNTNIPLVLSLVTKGIYSNPISSIIREITSNCRDANIEAGKPDEPIIINLLNDIEENQYYIEFIDKGVGMSEKTIDLVYTKFFSSTKRGSNDLIGGFGLGSKSPFSYTTSFYITTVFNNIKYEYIYYKDGYNFTLSLLNKTKVFESSGTSIKMFIKDDDKYTFKNALISQLAYFKNVYVNHNLYIYENEYTIYEGKYFKYNSDKQPYQNLHIILGEVNYKIDYSILNINPIEIPIGIKFEIGELKPTMERENIKYDDDSIILIKERINLCIEELRNYFSNQSFIFTDLTSYIKNKDNKTYLYFNKDKNHYINNNKLIKGEISYTYDFFNDNDFVLNVPEIFFMFNSYVYENKKLKELSKDELITYIKHRKYTIFYSEEGNTKTVNNLYHFNTNNYCILFTPRKLNYNKIIRYLNWYKKDNKYFHRIGKAKLLYNLKVRIQKEIINISYNYDIVSEDYIKEYYDKVKEANLENRLRNKEVVTYYNEYDRRDSITLINLLKYKYVFYQIKNGLETRLIYRPSYYENLLSNFNNWEKFKYKIIFITISETQYSKIKKYDNIIHISNILNLKIFNNYLYKVKLANLLNNERLITTKDATFKISNDYYINMLNTLREFSYKYSKPINLEEHKFKLPYGYCSYIIELFKEYKKVKDKLNIFLYITHYIPNEELIKINRTTKLIKLNLNLEKLNNKD